MFEDKKSCITINCGCCSNSNGNDGTPVGTIISYMGKKAPKHYLACNGGIYNIADYRDFSEFIKDEYGSFDFFGGDGILTFAVPDLRGEFLRGTGTATRNTGTGLDVGEHQGGTSIPFFGGDNTNKFWLYRKESDGINTPNYVDKVVKVSNGYGTRASISSDLAATWPHEESFTSRPTNTAVLYCIKYE